MNQGHMDTSAQALAQLGLLKLARQQREILDVVQGCQRNGAYDLTGLEICQTYERIYSKRIDPGRVSARVANLVAANLLQRRQDTRACSVSGRNVHPVYAPAEQARLCA